MSFFEDVLEALERADVRYLVVGGLAVVLHGHVRTTLDLDLIIDLRPEQARKAIAVLSGLGLEPSVPVDIHEFADPEARERFVRDKHMVAFPLRDPGDVTRRVDLFVREPRPFDELDKRALTVPFGRTVARVIGRQDLVELKREAARPQDLADIAALEAADDED
ncbi:MAG TPA: hypothetical protein VGB83_00940 [Actinomycetota bacterium]